MESLKNSIKSVVITGLMTEETVQQFFHYYKVFIDTSSTVQSRSAAEEYICQSNKIPENIFINCQLYQQAQGHELETIRFFSLINIRQMLVSFLGEYNAQQTQYLKDFYLTSIPREPVLLIRHYLCDSISPLINKRNGVPWPEIFDLANQMLQDPDLLMTGLYLWHLIVDSLNSQQEQETAQYLIRTTQYLIRTASESLQNPATEVRIQAMHLLESLIWLVFDYDEEMVNSMISILHQSLSECFYERRYEEEARVFVTAISEILSGPFPQLEQSYPDFVQFALQAVSNTQLPINLRVIAFDIIENGCFALLDEPTQDICRYFDMVIELTISVLQIEREDMTFEFSSGFLHNAGATIEGHLVFKYIFNNCNTLVQSGDLIQRQCALFLLVSIVESQTEAFAQHINDVLLLILQCDDDDLSIINYSCRLISELADYCPEGITVVIDLVVDYLLKHMNYIEALQALDRALVASYHPPRKLDSFLNEFLQYFQHSNETQRENIISCVASSISHPEEPIEDLYPLLSPILDSALQTQGETDDLRSSVVRCFGNLAQVCPISIVGDVENMISICLMPLEKTDTITNFHYDSIECIRKLCLYLPLVVGQFLSDIVANLFSIFEKFPIVQNESEHYIMSDNIIRLQGAAMRCIATFITAFPQQMDENTLDQFLGILKNAPESNEKILIYVCESVAIAAEGFKENNKIEESYNIISPFLSQLYSFDQKEIIIVIHKTLGTLITVYGREWLQPQTAKAINQHLLGGLGGQYMNYLMWIYSACIDIILQKPIFQCFTYFIHTLDESVVAYVDDIITQLEPYIKSKCKTIRGLTIELYARLCYITSSLHMVNEAEYLKLTFDSAYSNLTSHNIVLQSLVINALTYLLYSNKDIVTPQYKPTIFQHVQNILTQIIQGEIESDDLKHSSISLWCAFIMHFEIAPNPDIFSAIIQMMPPPSDTLHIPFTAVFAIYAKENYPNVIEQRFPFIAASVLGSSDWYITSVSEDIISQLASYLATLSQDDIAKCVGYNQSRLIKVLNNIQRYAPQ